MNDKQATVIKFAVLLTVMSFLTPPWLYEDVTDSKLRSAGYYFFTDQPQVKSDAEMREILSISKSERPHSFTVQKDQTRLFYEWAAILFLAISGIFLTVNRITPAKILIGFFSFCIGLVFAILVLLASSYTIF